MLDEAMAATRKVANVSERKSAVERDTDKLEPVFRQLNAVISDDDQQLKPWRNISDSTRLAAFMNLMVFASAVLLAIEVDMAERSYLVFWLLNIYFAILFSGELLLKMYDRGFDVVVDPWTFFDYFCVVLAFTDVFSKNIFQISAAVRLARFLRIVQSIRDQPMFQDLYLLINGIISCLRRLLWVGLMLVLLLYCGGIFMTTVCNTTEVRSDWQESYVYVGSVQKSMWTLLQVVTFDDWSDGLARPLSNASPTGTICLFFIMAFGGLAILNIVLAITVEGTLHTAKIQKHQVNADLEQAESELFQVMAEEFLSMDVGSIPTVNASKNSRYSDSSSEGDHPVNMPQKCLEEEKAMTIEQFDWFVSQPKFIMKMRVLGIPADEVEELFTLLDSDNSNTITPTEFIEGLRMIRGPARGQDMISFVAFCKQYCELAEELSERAGKLELRADDLQTQLEMVGMKTTDELKYGQSGAKRKDRIWADAAKWEAVTDRLQVDGIHFPELAGNPKKPRKVALARQSSIDLD
jgi:voltage-gated sodium channel